MSTPTPHSSLTPTSYVVLGIVDWIGRATAYEIKQRIERSVSNFWPVPRSQVYAEAARLADQGYLAQRQEKTGRRRKLYSLTKQGRKALAGWLGEADSSPPELRDPGLLKLFFGADPARIAGPRAEYHRSKQRELEGYAAMGDEEIPAGVRASLDAGVGFERHFARLWSELDSKATKRGR